MKKLVAIPLVLLYAICMAQLPASYGSLNHAHSTTDIAEGAKLFFTDARARAAISVAGNGSYNSATGVITVNAAQGSSYRNLVELTEDVTASNPANSLTDITGLSFDVVAGTNYRFYAIIPYTAAATSTGSRWTVNAPAATLLHYTSRYTLTATGVTTNNLSAVNMPAASNATSLTAGNIAIIEGFIRPSANGTVQIRFASEVNNSAIIAKAGATLEYW